MFYSDEQDRAIISRPQVVNPEQAWFWSKRWQRMERRAQADIDADRLESYDNIEQALSYLDQALKKP